MDRGGRPAAGVTQANPGHISKPNTGREPPLRRRKWRGAQAVEKSLYVDLVGDPYRKPTLVGRGKDPEVDERSSVKELGKLTP